jgi:putative transposase
MDASMMAWLKELEDENHRLKKMYAEERLKAEIISKTLAKKVTKPSLRHEMAVSAVQTRQISINTAWPRFASARPVTAIKRNCHLKTLTLLTG